MKSKIISHVCTIVFCAALLTGCGTIHRLFNMTPPTQNDPGVSHSTSWTAAPGANSTTPVKSTVDKLAALVWIGGILAIIGGGVAIYLGQLWLGLRIIGFSVAGIVAATWFAVHYKGAIACAIAAGVVWFIVDHASVRKRIVAEISSLKSDIEKKV